MKTILVALLALAPFALPTSVRAQVKDDLADRVEVYLHTAYPADHLGPEFEPALIRDLQAAPDRAWVLLQPRLQSLPDYLRRPPDEQLAQANALHLLAFSSEKGRELVAAQFRSAVRDFAPNQEIRTGWALTPEGRAYETNRQALTFWRRQALRTLGELRDDRILDDSLALAARADKATQNDTMRLYLRPVLASKSAALERVQRKLADPTDELSKHEPLRVLVRELGAATKAGGTQREKRE